MTNGIYIFLFLLIASCKSQEKQAEKPIEKTNIEVAIEGFVSKKMNCEKEENLVLHYKTGSCRGFCPQYEFTLYKNGNAIYKGERNVEKIGTYKRKLDEESINSFKNVLNEFPTSEIGDFDFKDYSVADIPVHNLKTNKNCYKFSYWRNTPEKIQETAKKVEKLIAKLKFH